MEILQAYTRNTKDKEIKLSTFITKNENVIAKVLASQTKEEDLTEGFIETYWVRIFQHVKKQYDSNDKMFITDKEEVNWFRINDEVLKIKTKNAKARIQQLAHKRQKLHCELHLQAEDEVVGLLVQGGSSTEGIDTDDADALFNTGPSFSILDIKHKIANWREAAQRIDPLHKQDLLFYNILDFVTTRQDVGVKFILQNQYSSAKEHLSSVFSINNLIDEEVNLLLQSVDSDAIKKISKKVMKHENNEMNCKTSKTLTKLYDLIDTQFKDDLNSFVDSTMNEHHFIMIFVFPLFYELFYDVSQKNIYQRWETKLYCAKKNEHSSLLDAERRTPGPSIDAVFIIPFLNNLEFFIIEVSGGPAQEDFEHFIGDRNKIAKNLKIMMKHIISLRTDWTTYKASTLKLYGLHIYRNEVYVYSLTNPYGNVYIFITEMNFSFPTMPVLLNQNFSLFMENLWKLKKMLLYSSKSVEHYIVDEESNSENEAGSNLSSPYVSPTKRKETKR
ncbi:hypothetical protein EDC94DRAFT_610619 [Helicostylum pulchrum]|nr:hypothetical protein EDC94DRAFT_610619 [Helicostylum pulchrum]